MILIGSIDIFDKESIRIHYTEDFVKIIMTPHGGSS
jgi:hypothetical protein